MSDAHANSPILQAGASVQDAKLAVVLLHGRGGSAEDILPLASAFDFKDVAYFAPQAAGHTWYPLSFMAPRAANEPNLSSALGRVSTVVQAIEQAGVRRDRIVIAGFSQGACLATEFVASHPGQYGGLIAFTGGLIGPPGSLNNNGRHTGHELDGMPALLSSGDPDPHVPWARVEESASILSAMGAAVTLRRYPGRRHTITGEELEDARRLLEQVKDRCGEVGSSRLPPELREALPAIRRGTAADSDAVRPSLGNGEWRTGNLVRAAGRAHVQCSWGRLHRTCACCASLRGWVR